MGNYITLEQAAAFLNVDVTQPQVASSLTLIIPTAERIIENYLQSVWYPLNNGQPFTQAFDGRKTDMITLRPMLDCTQPFTVQEVDIAGNVIYTYTDVVGYPAYKDTKGNSIGYNKYGVYRYLSRTPSLGGGVLFTSTPLPYCEGMSGFNAGHLNIQVTGVWGPATVPSELPYAVAMQCKHLWQYPDVNAFYKIVQADGRRLYQIAPEEERMITEFVKEIVNPLRTFSSGLGGY